MEFDELFAAAMADVPGVRKPFPYQTRLAEQQHLPWMLPAPTGAGKTAAVILAWVYRRRFHPDPRVRHDTPRRLVYCLPVRTLVEQTVQDARRWLWNLGEGAADLYAYQLMGGDLDRDWDRYPERDAVLIGTQDQLLSRALNRGYAMSRYRWPIHFAFLNGDVLWVMDEVQLMGPGLKTTAQLATFREQLGTYGPARSLWMSATMRPRDLLTVDFAPSDDELADRTLVLSSEDERHPVLSQRLKAAKPIAQAPLSLEASTRKRYPRDLAAAVYEAHQPGSLTLVILNQVVRAQETFLALRDLAALKDLAPPLLLHSRFRPADRAKLAERLREPVPADSAGRIVVATQTIEAGVDISARTLFTELCPWSSLVQRCGRCNREGEWGIEAPAQVYWIDVSSGKSDDFLPYKEEHLARTREVLAGLSDAGIESLDGAAEPEEPPVTQVLRRRDIVDLFDTTPDLAGNDIDVSPYIRDSDDLDVQVFWRTFGEDGKPEDDRPPAPEELCAVRLPEFRKFLDRASAEGRGVLLWDPLAGAWAPLRDYQLRPGLAILLDAAAGGYEADLGWWPSAKKPSVVPVIVPAPGTSSEAYEDDPTTPLTRAVSIADHHDHVVAQLRALCGALPELASDDLEALLLAARWHDAGKAHPSFQQRLTARLPEDDPRREGPILAKTPKCWYGRGAGRPYFRHELASALAMLQSGLPQLAVYLAAAHHGKVRLSIRSLPDERPPEDRPQARVARGVWEGDVLPEAELGDAVRMPETVLSLAPMELGECEGEPSWLARALALREALGPFRLAWLEALLRVADWRASEEEEKGCD